MLSMDPKPHGLAKQNFKEPDLNFFIKCTVRPWKSYSELIKYSLFDKYLIYLIFIKSVIFTEFTGLTLDFQDQGHTPEHTSY